MFKKAKNGLNDMIDEEIGKSVAALYDVQPSSEEYAKIVSNMKAMKETKDQENKLNVNTVVTVLGSVASVVAIIAFERFGGGIFTSKAAGFVMKPRV